MKFTHTGWAWLFLWAWLANAPAKPVIVDYAPGNFSEDLYALALMLHAPDLSIEAVTMTHSPYSDDPLLESRITTRFFNELGCRVPIGQGLPWPKDPDLPEFLRINSLEKWASGIEDDQIKHEDALTLMGQVLDSNPKTIILALGPLTNVAALINHDPAKSKERIERIVLMGGSLNYDYGGLPGSVAEYNLAIDLKSSQTVWNSGIPITLVPIDPSLDLILWSEDYKDLAKRSRTARLLHAASEVHFESWSQYHVGQNHPVLFDTFAAAVLIDPGMGYYLERNVALDERGFTRWGSSDDPLMKVYTLADHKGVRKLFRRHVVTDPRFPINCRK